MSLLSEPGSARQEAERLVATILAAATIAANAHPQLSTGSAECCVCPLCKVIAAVRDPDPEMVERVATGAGDLAAGVASFLRTLATPAQAPTSARAGDAWKTATADSAQDSAEARGAATRASRNGRASAGRNGAPSAGGNGVPKKAAGRKAGPKPGGEEPRNDAPAKKVVKKVVKKAVKKAAKKAAPRSTDNAGSADSADNAKEG